MGDATLQNPKLDNWHYFYFYPIFIAKTTSKGLRIKRANDWFTFCAAKVRVNV